MRQQISKFLNKLMYKIGRMLKFQNRFYNLPYKQYSELAFWKREIQKYIKWYEGKISSHYGVSAPTEKIKVKKYDLKENAILTWARAHSNKYSDLLLIPRDYFYGKRILDVGCGPIPYALAFANCEIYGLDPLINEYKKLGFPLDKYSDRLTYINCCAESIPIKENFFDAVISLNSLDHVDDFPRAANEISRVLRPKGVLRIEVGYHKPTTCEPWSLCDEVITKHFGHLGIRKISERLYNELFPEASGKRETLVVWANRE